MLHDMRRIERRFVREKRRIRPTLVPVALPDVTPLLVLLLQHLQRHAVGDLREQLGDERRLLVQVGEVGRDVTDHAGITPMPGRLAGTVMAACRSYTTPVKGSLLIRSGASRSTQSAKPERCAM